MGARGGFPSPRVHWSASSSAVRTSGARSANPEAIPSSFCRVPSAAFAAS